MKVAITIVCLLVLVVWCIDYKTPEEMLAEIRSIPSPFWGAKEAFADAGLSEEEYEPCLIWAFGEEWNKTTISSLMDMWRQRHSDLFIIRDADYAYDAFKRIGEAYKKTKEPNEPVEIVWKILEEPSQAHLYFDAQEGRLKFEGDMDLAAQGLFEMFQSEIDEYIREHCEPK